MMSLFERPAPKAAMLRPYQVEAVECATRAMGEEARSGLIVMPTGTGKTEVMISVAASAMQRGKRVGMLAHRIELVDQFVRKLATRTGVDADIEQGESRVGRISHFHRSKAMAAMVQSISRRLDDHNPNHFGLLMTDEAHHASAPMYERIYEHFHQNAGLYHLGVTATPKRGDGIALARNFARVVFEYPLYPNAIEDGWLVKPVSLRVKTGIDWTGIEARGGDFTESSMAPIVEDERNLASMVVPMCAQLHGRRCLVFCATVNQAKAACYMIGGQRISAEYVHGEMNPDDRRAVFDRFACGKTQVLCNVGIATEGWDDPATDGKGVQVIAVMRPTKSLSLFLQMIGRGTRPLPGTVDRPELDTPANRIAAIAASKKPKLTIIDFGGNFGAHGKDLITLADALAGNMDRKVVERAAKMIEEAGAERDVVDLLAQAQAKIQEELEKARLAKVSRGLKPLNADQAREVDPFSFFGTTRRQRPAHLNANPMTQKQRDFLANEGLPLDLNRLSGAEASDIIAHIQTMPSQKTQARLAKVEKMPIDEIRTMTRSAGNAILAEYARSGWRPLGLERVREIAANDRAKKMKAVDHKMADRPMIRERPSYLQGVVSRQVARTSKPQPVATSGEVEAPPFDPQEVPF